MAGDVFYDMVQTAGDVHSMVHVNERTTTMVIFTAVAVKISALTLLWTSAVGLPLYRCGSQLFCVRPQQRALFQSSTLCTNTAST